MDWAQILQSEIFWGGVATLLSLAVGASKHPAAGGERFVTAKKIAKKVSGQ